MYAKRSLAVALVATLAVLIGQVEVARAEPGVSCEVLEIKATQAATPSIPDSLKKLAKKLKRPPLSSWNFFELLSSSTHAMSKLVPKAVPLSTGAAELLVRDIDRASGKRPRIALGVTMNDGAGRRVVDTKASIDAADYFAVGYSTSDNSGHLIAVSCK